MLGTQILFWLWSKEVVILISHLEDIADITEVATSIKHKQWMDRFLVIHIYLTFIYKIDTRAHNIMHDDALLMPGHVNITEFIRE